MAKTIDEGSATDRARSRIRELRGERALTLEAVAARTGIGVSTLSRLDPASAACRWSTSR